MGIVGSRPAELIIGLPRPEGTTRQVLQLTAPAIVSNLDVELAVGAEQDLAAIVVSSHGLTGVRLK